MLIFFTINHSSASYMNDNFNVSHNYLSEGTAGTIWNGMIGLNSGETVDVLNASVTQTGELYMASTGGLWTQVWNPLGPFLYRTAVHVGFPYRRGIPRRIPAL